MKNINKSLDVVKKNILQKTQYVVLQISINDDLSIKHIFHKDNDVFDSESLADLYCDNSQKRDSLGYIYKVVELTTDKKVWQKIKRNSQNW